MKANILDPSERVLLNIPKSMVCSHSYGCRDKGLTSRLVPRQNGIKVN